MHFLFLKKKNNWVKLYKMRRRNILTVVIEIPNNLMNIFLSIIQFKKLEI
jgi:hypothetical protein